MCWVVDRVDPLRLLQRNLSPFVYKPFGEDTWRNHCNDSPSPENLWVKIILGEILCYVVCQALQSLMCLQVSF